MATTASTPSDTEPVVSQTPALRERLRTFFALDLLDNRHPSLHGLRVLAIVSVLQFHITAIYWQEWGIPLDPRFAQASMTVFFGMDLFFYLSGFLIGSILLRSIEVDKKQNVRRFYLRRIFRTFPSYYVVLTVLACTMTLTDAQHYNLPYEYVYATNFRPLRRVDVVMFWGWSLALEEQFYLTVPIFLFLLSRLRSDSARAGLLVVAWASALGIRLWYYHAHSPLSDLELYDQIYFRTKTRFDPLVAGIFLAFIQHRWREQVGRWLQRPRNRAILAVPTLTCLWDPARPAVLRRGEPAARPPLPVGHGHEPVLHGPPAAPPARARLDPARALRAHMASDRDAGVRRLSRPHSRRGPPPVTGGAEAVRRAYVADARLARVGDRAGRAVARGLVRAARLRGEAVASPAGQTGGVGQGARAQRKPTQPYRFSGAASVRCEAGSANVAPSKKSPRMDRWALPKKAPSTEGST
jgi:hypothetical protein